MYMTRFNSISNLLDKVLDDFTHSTVTSTNVSEHFFTKTETGYSLELLLPGMNKENLKVDVDENILKISGEFKSKLNSYKIDKTYKLWDNVDVSKVTAEIKDGVLTINLPTYVEKKKTKKIELI